MSSHIGTVYLLHYFTPIARKRHYLGFTKKRIEARLREHRSGDVGSQLTNTAVKLGHEWLLVKTWEGVSVDFEKKLKRERHLHRHCNICTTEQYLRSLSALRKVLLDEDQLLRPVAPEGLRPVAPQTARPVAPEGLRPVAPEAR